VPVTAAVQLDVWFVRIEDGEQDAVTAAMVGAGAGVFPPPPPQPASEMLKMTLAPAIALIRGGGKAPSYELWLRKDTVAPRLRTKNSATVSLLGDPTGDELLELC
jgi:hypothetical protein